MPSASHGTGAGSEYSFSGTLARDDLPLLGRLLSRAFGLPFTEEYLEWKYFKNPVGLSASALARFKGEIVGFIGVVPAKYVVGGEEIIAGQGVDMAIDQAHRRLDVFIGLLAQSEANARAAAIKFLYGVMNADAMEINDVLSFQTLVGRIPRLVRVLKPVAAFAARSLAPPLRPLAALHALALRASFLKKDRLPPEGTHFSIPTRFDERTDRLWQRMRNEADVAAVHDSRFLNWRLVDIPRMETFILCVENDSDREIRGCIACSIVKENGARRGKILDIQTPRDEHPAVVRSLLDAALRWLDRRGAEFVDCWMPPRDARHAVMLRRGFVSATSDTVRLYYNAVGSAASPAAALLAEPERWRLFICDSDMYTLSAYRG